MYARTYNDGNETLNTKKAEYNIPSNYRGTAFDTDSMEGLRSGSDKDENTASEVQCVGTAEAEKDYDDSPHLQDSEACEKPSRKKGLLGGILSRIGRDLELDDIILIGLIALILLEKKEDKDGGADEIIILLALLLFGGF